MMRMGIENSKIMNFSTGDLEFDSWLGILWSNLRVNDESEEKEDVNDCKSNKGVVERRLHLRPQQNQDGTFVISYIYPYIYHLSGWHLQHFIT